jgi:hypothetical protein
LREFETDFQTIPYATKPFTNPSQASSTTWKTESEQTFQPTQTTTRRRTNNRYWIDAYGLQDELTPEVPTSRSILHSPRFDLSRHQIPHLPTLSVMMVKHFRQTRLSMPDNPSGRQYQSLLHLPRRHRRTLPITDF